MALMMAVWWGHGHVDQGVPMTVWGAPGIGTELGLGREEGVGPVHF